MATALPWILRHQQSVTRIDRRLLKRAALRLFKPDYHAMRAKNGGATGSHRQADFHASLRLLHGAALDGWISPDDWLGASNEVLKSSQAAIAWDKETSFFKALSAVDARRGVAPEEFGTIIILDDEEFWLKALEPMWRPYGISVRQAKTLEQLRDVSSRAPVGHARVILLDMRFGDRKYQGADFLQTIKLSQKGVPIIVLSVEDDLSVANLLRREGVFASISKQTSAEERGSRDEMSAFWQLRDAIVLGLFSSLSHHLGELVDFASKALGEDVPIVGQSIDALRVYVVGALHAYHQECWGIYSDTWEGTGHSRGLSCRQIIRALGVMNDKWCEAWTAWQFDPDTSSTPWVIGINPGFFGKKGEEHFGTRTKASARYIWNLCVYRTSRHTRFNWLANILKNGEVNRSIPYRTFHNITTQLRNAASHAIVRDEFFRWGDVWVMMLTLFLKVEGLHRSLTSEDRRADLSNKWDDKLMACTKAVSGLLHLAGYVDADDVWSEPIGFEQKIDMESEVLRDQLREWERAKWDSIKMTADLEQLVAGPFSRRHLKDGPLLHELQSSRTVTRTPAQLHGDLLLLKLVNTRLARFRAAL